MSFCHIEMRDSSKPSIHLSISVRSGLDITFFLHFLYQQNVSIAPHTVCSGFSCFLILRPHSPQFKSIFCQLQKCFLISFTFLKVRHQVVFFLVSLLKPQVSCWRYIETYSFHSYVPKLPSTKIWHRTSDPIISTTVFVCFGVLLKRK